MEGTSDELNENINGSDNSDALGFSFVAHPIVNLISAIFTSGSSNKKKALDFIKSPVDKDDFFYNMNHKKRGMAIIFNHEKFIVPNLKDRIGTEVDCERLRKCLQQYDFDVVVHENLGVKKIIETVENVASMDHSDNDCLLMIILTHGEQGVLFAHDGAYKHEHIFDNFRGDRCPTLAGKPKLFFIQACQGSKLDSGVMLSTQVDASSVYAYKIPVYADFLVVYSTIPGFYSWRNTTNGSWFIQALITEFEDSFYKYDLLTMLTFVCRRVALDFESNVPNDITMHNQKQMPCITSMLTRLVKFSSKQQQQQQQSSFNSTKNDQTFNKPSVFTD